MLLWFCPIDHFDVESDILSVCGIHNININATDLWSLQAVTTIPVSEQTHFRCSSSVGIQGTSELGHLLELVLLLIAFINLCPESRLFPDVISWN